MVPENNIGKKIIFLYPPSWIKEEYIEELVSNEYETFSLENHKILFPLLKSLDSVFLFINIDNGPKENEWEKYVSKILSSPLSEKVTVCVMTNNNAKELVSKYIGSLKVDGGFIILRQRIADVKKSIYKVLTTHKAKGRRRFVRAKCNNDNKATFNAYVDGSLKSGKIRDISSVGMACHFDESTIQIKQKQPISDIQLRLMGKIVTVSGVIAGIRQERERVYVILFDPKTAASVKEKIHSFIKYALDNWIQQRIRELSTTVSA